MSDKNKNIRIVLKDFFRYNRDELSGEERNSFERELQKDPFVEEAAEGYVLISEEEALKDTADLQRRLRTRNVHKHRFLIYSIAASVTVLMVISTLFILIVKNKTEKQLAYNTNKSRALEITKNQPIEKPAPKDKASEKLTIISESKPNKPVSPETRVETEKVSVKPEKSVEPDEKLQIVEEQKDKSVSEFKEEPLEINVAEERKAVRINDMTKKSSPASFAAKGKVLSTEDNLPVPGANVLIKGAKTGVVTDAGGNFNIELPDSGKKTLIANFIGMESKEVDVKADTQVQIRLEPAVTSLSEVVVVGYGVKKAESDNEESVIDYTRPHPIVGKSEFDKYIQNNLHRPDSSSTGQRVVVVVSFMVSTDGRIDSIRIIKSPGKQYSDEAVRVIKSGPSWKPANKNGKPLEDEVRLRIVFR